MSKITTWRKTIRFMIKDKNHINDFFKERDKEKYPIEGDYIVDMIREFKLRGIKVDSELTPLQIEDLPRLCSRNLLSVIDGLPYCYKRVHLGIGNREPMVYPEMHPLEGKWMHYDEIEKHCSFCTTRFMETSRLKELREKLEAEVKASIPDEIDAIQYACVHPDSPDLQEAFKKDEKFVCINQQGKQVRIDRTCIKAKCVQLRILKIKVPFKIDEG